MWNINTLQKAIYAHVIDVSIKWVSNYKKFKSDTCTVNARISVRGAYLIF